MSTYTVQQLQFYVLFYANRWDYNLYEDLGKLSGIAGAGKVSWLALAI